jgi:hypothetical protein
LAGEKVFGALPYPLLGLHLGKPIHRFYTPITYNLMNYGEFVKLISTLRGSIHPHFEGISPQSNPSVETAEVGGLVGTANVIYGGLSQSE